MELRDLYREMRDLKPGTLTRANVAFLLEEGRSRHETGKFSVASTRHVTTAESQDMTTAEFWHRRLHPVERRDRKPGEVKIGRVKGADVQIELSSVSSNHAVATQVTRGQWTIADTGSKNGTLVDGVKLKTNEPVPLRSGSVVCFGAEVTLTFLDGTAMERILRQLDPALARVAAVPGSLDPGTTEEITTHRLAGLEPPQPGLLGGKLARSEVPVPPPPPPPPAPVSALTPSEPIKLPTRTVVKPPAPAPAAKAAGNEAPLALSCPPFPAVGLASGVPVVVGRAIGADLILPHPNVSRRHSCFERQGSQIFVADMGSGNGTWVDKKRIGGKTPVKPGQEVGIGPYKVLVVDQSAPTPVVNHDLGTRIEGEV